MIVTNYRLESHFLNYDSLTSTKNGKDKKYAYFSDSLSDFEESEALCE